ncbi:zinc-dependent metalloprotease [Streptomyces sp. NBC_01237]|uniref:zinc-dependent metalloprotease n=1 Tax=Streptomyces sp. NBC_01237 TaxID=2903790 RepID=UPI002DDA390C|nr:zinc-dependent metalloprotease [Streptomyces sp. NBC_01237]WRZ77201.1 zinc-dependent metalloprotease [Streptomyces sp. NBC_01237]
MTELTVLDNTGKTGEVHDDLVGRISESLAEAAPMVRDVTKLGLPRATYDLRDRSGWVAEYGRRARGAAERDSAHYELSRFHKQLASGMPRVATRIADRAWTLADPEPVVDSQYKPTILISVDALEHQGVLENPAALTERLIRSLAHLAQITASRGVVVPPRIWPPHASHPSRPAHRLMDGHAQWVVDAVAPSLLGQPDERRRLKPSARHRRQAFLTQLFDCGRTERRARQGARFVAQAIAGSGHAEFNAVWRNAGLVPTERELARPDEWLGRRATLAAAPGVEPAAVHPPE